MRANTIAGTTTTIAAAAITKTHHANTLNIPKPHILTIKHLKCLFPTHPLPLAFRSLPDARGARRAARHPGPV